MANQSFVRGNVVSFTLTFTDVASQEFFIPGSVTGAISFLPDGSSGRTSVPLVFTINQTSGEASALWDSSVARECTAFWTARTSDPAVQEVRLDGAFDLTANPANLADL